MSLLKILTVGSSGVGKTALLLRYVENTFVSSFISTIGIDFRVKHEVISVNPDAPGEEGISVKLQICKIFFSFFISLGDTAGQERFKTIVRSYYRGADGVLLVYDISDRDSFDAIRNWVEQLDQHAPANISKCLVGNKCDLDYDTEPPRVISEEEGRKLAQLYKMEFIETSAASSTNVEEVFQLMARQILKKRGLLVSPSDRKADEEKNVNLGSETSTSTGDTGSSGKCPCG